MITATASPPMSFLSPRQRARILILSASIVSICIFWWMGAVFRVPAHPGGEASLLQQPAPIAVMLIVGVVFLICVSLATVIAGMIRYDAGLLAACIGLLALSARGGSVREAIFFGLARLGSPAVFLTFLYEILILGLLVGLCGYVLTELYARSLLKDRESGLPPLPEPPFSSYAVTFAVQALLTAVGVLVLARSDEKLQVIAAVTIASLAGAAVAESFVPPPTRALAGLPPILVGAIGYILAYYDPTGYQTADLKSSFAPLARPLPLDYAGAGPAGALLGYWMARRWARQHASLPAAQSH